MDQLFGELRRLPCTYCRFSHGYAPKCLKRSQEIGELDICEDMLPDIDIVSAGITGYFEYLGALKQ